ncbi:transcriptional regulator [Streptomyces sp. HPF1205]|uniref:transcriptional regulator n=1 Tax=Streptomyces sp. HPF1205 TaxID=2873262 RepID=UPI001CEDC8AD|nr:transcriptional regulator [Streptomyces sp. HPF1205]
MPQAACKASQETLAAARPRPRTEELARRLAVMMPQAAVLRITLQGPYKPWPHLEVRARDAHGHPVRISRTQELVAARWIIRAHPDAGWQKPRTFDLRTARLGGEAL